MSDPMMELFREIQLIKNGRKEIMKLRFSLEECPYLSNQQRDRKIVFVLKNILYAYICNKTLCTILHFFCIHAKQFVFDFIGENLIPENNNFHRGYSCHVCKQIGTT